MICPACRSAMLVVEYHKIELDHCNSCKGVWLDSHELELLLQSHSFEETKAFLDEILSSEEAASPEKRRDCPICGNEMKKIAIGRQHEIVIDVCPNDHGMWFDGGEVGQLMRHLAREHPQSDDSRERIIGFLEEVFEAPEQTGEGHGSSA